MTRAGVGWVSHAVAGMLWGVFAISPLHAGPPCPCDDGDFNMNGVVDIDDILLVVGCFGEPPAGSCLPADLNCDGAIDMVDIDAIQCLFAELTDCCRQCTCDGDLDMSGLVDIDDVITVSGCYGMAPEGECASADIDCDGDIDLFDVDEIQCLFAGLPGAFCCGQCPCFADIVTDGIVDIDDILLAVGCVGLPPIGACELADINCDGAIEEIDVGTILCLKNHPAQVCCRHCLCNGDVNGSGLTDVDDVILVSGCFGQPPAGPCAAADLNCNLVIDLDDVAAVQCRFGGGSAAACCPGCTFPGAASGCLDDTDCTVDVCNSDLTCSFPARVYGDIDTPPNGIVELGDILCMLDGFTNPPDCPNADIAPCEGNGIIDVDDILAVLDAYGGADPCCGG